MEWRGIEKDLIEKYAVLLKITTKEKLNYGMTQEEYLLTVEQMCVCFYNTLLDIQEVIDTPLKCKMYINAIVDGTFRLGR